MTLAASKRSVTGNSDRCQSDVRLGRSVSVIIPTYKEAENLKTLLPAVSRVLAASGLRGEIIVVDDASEDGTTTACRDAQTETPVLLIVRAKERGLATAVIRGMEEASGDVLVVMDGDFSHPPATIPKLVNSLESSEFAFGSRYVTGASMHDDWNVFRNMNSRIATLLARGLTDVSDPMSGFFAVRREVFQRSHSELSPVGYKIGLELLVRGSCREVKEVPIHFAERRHGESKLSFIEQARYLRHLTRLYRTKVVNSPIIRFGLAGMAGMVVDLTAFGLLLNVTPPPIARTIAISLAMVLNYFLNRRFTFEKKGPAAFIEFVNYCTVCTIGATTSWVLSMALIFFELAPSLIAASAGVLLGAVVNYFGCRHVAFATANSA